jgi:DNA (cytosine-5)-methyltransferase 1
MSSVEDIRVNLSVRLASGTVKKIRAICGLGLEKPLANYDPNTRSWKMYEATLVSEDCPSLENLPPSGMTRNGVLYLQRPWEPITGETVLLSWPTPTTQEVEHPNATWVKEGQKLRRIGKGKRGHSMGLADAVQTWPTPTARDHKGAFGWKDDKRNLADLTYLAQIADGHRIWPTPQASSWGSTGHRMILAKRVLDGTISETDKKQMTSGNGGRLNPTWVEWLMGFPLGWTDLEDSETP